MSESIIGKYSPLVLVAHEILEKVVGNLYTEIIGLDEGPVAVFIASILRIVSMYITP
jgi:hypothetical protein